jgi:NifU-like protein
MWNYTDKVQEHFINPKNVGELEKPSGTGEVGSLACGDALKLTIQVDEFGIITDAKFKTFGCASAIASSSVLTEIIKGMHVNEAAKLTNQQIADALGGLPKEKMHCSVMGREALEAAIADYRGVILPMAQGNVVCECFGVTDLDIIRAVRESNLRSVEDITNFTKAGKPAAPRLTTLQKIKKIEEVIEREILPTLKKDGGGIELIDVDGDIVTVSLRGACSRCQSSQATLKEYVEKKLREQVAETLIVEEAR